jgi:hypothetical protein
MRSAVYAIRGTQKGWLHFRNNMEVAQAASKFQLEDPDGNPIELFEPRFR